MKLGKKYEYFCTFIMQPYTQFETFQNFKKSFEKNCHAVTKLDTHLVKTGHYIYIYIYICSSP